MSNDGNRVSSRVHLFADTGHQPWRWVGVHPSCRPKALPLIDFSKLPPGNFVYVGMLRDLDGLMVGQDGISFYGPPKNMNGWLASVLVNEVDTTREIIVKKILLSANAIDVKPGRTPSLGLSQETWIHLVIAPLKKGEAPLPSQANVKKNNRYYRIVELQGFDLVDPDEDMRATVMPYVNPDADLIREWLDKSYSARGARVEARAALEAEKEVNTDDNPF